MQDARFFITDTHVRGKNPYFPGITERPHTDPVRIPEGYFLTDIRMEFFSAKPEIGLYYAEAFSFWTGLSGIKSMLFSLIQALPGKSG